jgi:hypothetical protein
LIPPKVGENAATRIPVPPAVNLNNGLRGVGVKSPQKKKPRTKRGVLAGAREEGGESMRRIKIFFCLPSEAILFCTDNYNNY